jgi:protein-tyrosine phosphatase
MLRILFLCYGNICRSPLAEGILADLAQKANLPIHCDSAGTVNYHVGDLPYFRSREVALKHGITLTHRCRLLVASDFEKFDYILAMDKLNVREAEKIAAKAYEVRAKLLLFRSFDKSTTETEVPDPYGMGDKTFEETYQMLLRCCEGFLEELQIQPKNA